MTLQEVLRHFDGVKQCSDSQYMARCPCHDDRKQSLSIGSGEKGVVLKCQAGCDTRAIIARVGLKPADMFYEQRSKPQERPQIEAIYNYPGGVQKIRYADKRFKWRRPDGKGGWTWNRQGVKPSLYIAGELAGSVAVAEGEKDANNLHRLGWDAVSGADGAGPGKWKPEYTEQLKGLHVCIFQDNDAVGKAYAQETAAALHGVAASVRVLDLSTVWPEIPEHGDVSDLIAKFGDDRSCELMAHLSTTTPEWEPEDSFECFQGFKGQGENLKNDISGSDESVFDSFGFYTIPDLTEEEKKPPEFIVDGMVPCGLTFLSGAPKIRKTFMGLQLAFSVANEQPFLGHKTLRCDVAYLDLEGSKSRAAFRAEKMSMEIPRNVFITNGVKERLADGLVDKLWQLHRENPQIRLIIIDTYSRSRGRYLAGGANAYDADVSLLEPVQRMALDENIAILFIHHDKKGAGFTTDSFERMSGTMGISGSADSVLNLIADGKRFDGKATLEYTPRDAKGGEMHLVFDERFGEWQEIVEPTKNDIRGNPICDWIISNAPEKGREGVFIPYEDVFKFAYRCQTEDPGDKVREQLASRRSELYASYGIGVQMGVKSNSKRGIRIINLL